MTPGRAQSYRCQHHFTDVRKTSALPCFQGDVAVEEPVVLCAAGVVTVGRTLGRNGAVCGCGTWVASWRVVAPVQGVNGGRMVLRIGRVGMGEW